MIQDPSRELFEALIQAGAKTHGAEADVYNIPLFEVAIHADLLSVALRLLENGAGVDVNRLLSRFNQGLVNRFKQDPDRHFSFINRILFELTGSNDEKVELLNCLAANGLDVNPVDRWSCNTLLHDYMFEDEHHRDLLSKLLNFATIKGSLYKLDRDNETAWEKYASKSQDHWLDDSHESRYLDHAEKLILAMDPEEIMHKKTIDKDGNEEPTQLARFYNLLTEWHISKASKQKIAEAFVLKKLTPWVIKKKTGIDIDCGRLSLSCPWEELVTTVPRWYPKIRRSNYVESETRVRSYESEERYPESEEESEEYDDYGYDTEDDSPWKNWRKYHPDAMEKKTGVTVQ